jgi:hypothetical protein
MKAFPLLGAAALVLVAASLPAAAEWRRHDSVFFGFSGPAYYYPPPVAYYPPPPGIYAPPPVIYAAPPVAYAPPPDQIALGREVSAGCREYTTPANVGGRTVQTFGTACLQPDGTWRIVR